MVVQILVKCRGEKDLPISLLVFDTIRVGFPTARLRVVDNGSDFGREEIEAAALKVGAVCDRWPRLARGDFIARILETATEPTVFVDTDVIFWENCEDIALPEGKLYGGRMIPEATECGWRMPARIHPSLFFVPDPTALREALAPFSKRLWYFKPFQGYTTLEGEKTVCWDVNSTLLAALPAEAHAFGEDELNRYDHLFAGTYADRLEEIGMDAATAARIRLAHTVALGPERNSLRGLWREQGPSQLRRSLPSWRYWSGILSNGTDRLGVMHAVFEAPGMSSFTHSSILDLRTNELHAGESWRSQVSLPPLPVPMVPRRHSREHASDTVAVEKVSVTVGAKTYDGMSGELWYEYEERQVAPGEGWRWISMRLDNGNNFMFYDRTDAPPRYAVLTRDGWAPVEAVVDVLGRDTYEAKWEVRFGHKALTILPVVPGQEIVDATRRFSYLEALCDVFSDSKRVGYAYVEVVPAKQAVARQVISKPSEAEMHLRWANNDPDAAFLIDCFGYATQLADDLVDLDRQGVKSVIGRSQVMAEVLYVLLIKIPGNPFFRKHEMAFVPLFTNCLVQWDASNTWAESEKKETRMFAYVQRETTARLVEHVAYLSGGFQFAKQVAREIHEYYHGAGMVESFDQFEAERKEATR